MCEIRDCSGEKVIGGQCYRETPGPMPNPAVKPVSVDGTMWGTHGRVDRRQFRLIREEVSLSWGTSFFVVVLFFE